MDIRCRPASGGEVALLFPFAAAAFAFAGWGLMQAAWSWSEDDIAHNTQFVEQHVGPGAGGGA